MRYYDYRPIFADLMSRSIDSDTGEILNKNFLEELAALELAKDERVEQAGLAFLNAKVELDSINGLLKSLKAKKERLERQMEFFKDYVTIQLDGHKFKNPMVSIYYGHRASVDILDEESIPEEFWKVERTVRKAEIQEAIKAGAEVPGVAMKDTKYTVIR